MRLHQLNTLCVAFQTGPESQRLQEIYRRIILVMRVDQTPGWFVAVDQRAGDVKSRPAPGIETAETGAFGRDEQAAVVSPSRDIAG